MWLVKIEVSYSAVPEVPKAIQKSGKTWKRAVQTPNKTESRSRKLC